MNKLPLSPGCGCCEVEICFQVLGCSDGVFNRKVPDATVTVTGPLPSTATVGVGITDSTGKVCLPISARRTYRATASHPRFDAVSVDFVPTTNGQTVTIQLIPPVEGDYGERKICVTCCPYPLSRSLNLHSNALGDIPLNLMETPFPTWQGGIWGGGLQATATPYYDIRYNPYTPGYPLQYACGYVWDPSADPPAFSTGPQQVDLTFAFDGCVLGVGFTAASPPSPPGFPYYAWGLWPSGGDPPEGWLKYTFDPNPNFSGGAIPFRSNCDPLVFEWQPGFTIANPQYFPNPACNGHSIPNNGLLAAVFGGGDYWAVSES